MHAMASRQQLNNVGLIFYGYRAQVLKNRIRVSWDTYILIFTALHVMQTRSSDENSVCPSVCPSVRLSVTLSNAYIVTKRNKDMFRFLYYTKDHLV